MKYSPSEIGIEDKLLIRILFIGKSGVGKTSFMLRYTDNQFFNNYVRTIAVDCRSKPNLIQGRFVKVCIFDPPGDDEFSTITPAYWHIVEVIVFIASYDQAESFNYIKAMEVSIFQEATSKALRIVLINKSDLKESIGREANNFEEEIKIWAESKKIKIVICSAKEGFCVTEPIDEIVKEFMQNKICDKGLDPEDQEKIRCKCSIF